MDLSFGRGYIKIRCHMMSGTTVRHGNKCTYSRDPTRCYIPLSVIVETRIKLITNVPKLNNLQRPTTMQRYVHDLLC